MLQYTLKPHHPHQHLWSVRLTFDNTGEAAPATLSLPNWVPGSYMIREFARHIVSIETRCNQEAACLTQINKNTWQTGAQTGQWQIDYLIYAHDLSVRGAYLDAERGFFDGACIFLQLHGRETQPHRLHIKGLPDHWQTATTLPCLKNGEYQAASYAELIDHPFEFGRIETLAFTACGIPHRIALSGHYADFSRQRLLNDIQKICTAQLALFPTPAPFTEYLFLLHVGDNIYGGLEHGNSTALLADRNSLPQSDSDEADEGYLQLLGLFSHEYFHAWNVKSIKPAAFTPYRLDEESYTEQLWAFEGITSYYDDLMLVRSGVLSPEGYLKLLAQNIGKVQQTPGRNVQTLAESSFTAWTKFYKQNENSPNALVSYYQQGALLALCLDLYIRRESAGRFSLDHIMQSLYRDWCANRQGLPENHWQQHAEALTGLNLKPFFQQALHSTEPLPLENSLAAAGIGLVWQASGRNTPGTFSASPPPAAAPATDFGARFKQNADNITLSHVFTGGSAEQAGLSAQDRIIALNGFACTDFARQWARLPAGTEVRLHYFRHGVLHETILTIQAARADSACLYITDATLLQNWLQAP